MLERTERERLTKLGSVAARKIGFDRAAYLDSGGNGIAMLVSDGIIMKVTTDGSEYVEASKIKGKKTKHLADVYGIWAIRNEEHKGTYIITKEIVDVGRDSHKKITGAKNTLSSLWEPSDLDAITNESDLDAFLLHYWRRSDASAMPQIEEAIAKGPADAKWFLNQIIGLMDEMKHLGVTGIDWMTDECSNLGLKNGNIAYYDIGYGETKHVDMNYLELENARREVSHTIRHMDAETYNRGL